MPDPVFQVAFDWCTTCEDVVYGDCVFTPTGLNAYFEVSAWDLMRRMSARRLIHGQGKNLLQRVICERCAQHPEVLAALPDMGEPHSIPEFYGQDNCGRFNFEQCCEFFYDREFCVREARDPQNVMVDALWFENFLEDKLSTVCRLFGHDVFPEVPSYLNVIDM